MAPSKRKRQSTATNVDAADPKVARLDEDLAAYANKEIHHKLDPKGDTILVLRPTKAPFAVWMHDNEWPNALDQSKSTESTHPNQPTDTVAGTTEQQTVRKEEEQSAEVLFRLSSRHLVLASGYYQKLFEGPWKESGTPTFDTPRVLVVDEWSEKAFLVLMDIIHGRSRQVSKKVTLEFAAELSVLVDYYQCHDAVDVYAERWLAALPPEGTTDYNRTLILRLSVAWVFSQSEILGKIYWTILSQCRGPIQTLELPIPSSVVEQLDATRQKLVGGMFEYAFSTMRSFQGQTRCAREGLLCDQAMLGILTKAMMSGDVLFHPPEKPYYGYSWNEVTEHFRESPASTAHGDGCSIVRLFDREIEILHRNIQTFYIRVPKH